MPNFRLRDAPGFEGRFEVVPEAALAPTPDEQRFCQRINQLMNFLADLGDPDTALARLRVGARADIVERLKQLAESFVDGRLAPDQAVLATYVIQGRWQAAVARVNQTPFVVEEVDAQGAVIEPGAGNPPRDLRIMVFDLPIGAEKLGFKVDVDRTLTIIKVVLRDTGARFWSRAQVAAEEHRRANYIHQLAGIARVGLQGREVSLTTMAKQSLLSLQEEFVAMEAGSVKNRYLRRLGWRCLLAAALSVVAYCLCRSAGAEAASIPYAFRNFFLLTAGTAVGTWISFSLRRVILTFLDLAAHRGGPDGPDQPGAVHHRLGERGRPAVLDRSRQRWHGRVREQHRQARRLGAADRPAARHRGADDGDRRVQARDRLRRRDRRQVAAPHAGD